MVVWESVSRCGLEPFAEVVRAGGVSAVGFEGFAVKFLEVSGLCVDEEFVDG